MIAAEHASRTDDEDDGWSEPDFDDDLPVTEEEREELAEEAAREEEEREEARESGKAEEEREARENF